MTWAYGFFNVVLLAEGSNHGSHEIVMSYGWVEFLQILHRRANRCDASSYHRLLSMDAMVQHSYKRSASNNAYF